MWLCTPSSARSRLGLALVVMTLGCTIGNVKLCNDDSECVRAGEQGSCEATHYCSFHAQDCQSGNRYGPAAGGELANACVGGSDTSASGGSR